MTMIAAGLLLGGAGMAAAGVPSVATDIPPVHGLVARVMQGLGAPALVVPPGASPHGYALRPSEAASLEQADLVVWTGEALTPWLERPIGSLARGAGVLELLAVPGTHLLDFREGVRFEPHHHDGGGEEHGEEHGHEDAHGQEAHGHHGFDPHAWLDPENAMLWLDAISAELGRLDPENAGAYEANAAAGKLEIAAAAAAAGGVLSTVADRPYVVFHDAYHYFEAAMGIEAAGALSLGDAADPGPARLAEVRDLIAETGAVCVFAEPQFNPRLIATVTEGTEVKTGRLDPLGSDLAPGPDFYPELLEELAANMVGCLG
nr:zinc ABC transporter substrate-binding protein [Mangrovicoccus sp. HB161399]